MRLLFAVTSLLSRDAGDATPTLIYAHYAER